MKMDVFSHGTTVLRLQRHPLSSRFPHHLLRCSELTTHLTFSGGDKSVNYVSTAAGMKPNKDSHGLHEILAIRGRQQLLFYSGTSTL